MNKKAVLEWLSKNRNKVYAVVLVVVGLAGGNVDRLDKIVKSLSGILTPTPVVVEDTESK